MRQKLLVGLVALAMLASGVGALVGSFSVASASVTTFTATADATISAASPAKNYGATTTLVADASPVKSFLVKFDVQTGGCAPLTRATLSLSIGTGLSDNSQHGGVFSSAGTGWTEGAVTWSNAPVGGATLGTLGAVVQNTTYAVDVSAAVATDGPVAFRVDSPNPDGVYYLSKEGSATKAPQLAVTCGGATTTSTSSTSTSTTTTTTTLPAGDPPCVGASAPATYQHVIVVMEENRTWSAVGPAFASMPYMHSLAASCAYYPDWTETNPAENSLTQYVGLTSGVNNPATANDCYPSPTCRSTDDNIFRQVRVAGGIPRSYVEGATTGCDTVSAKATHVPALYYFGGSPSDDSFCSTEVRPLAEFDVSNLPTLSFVTPNTCNDGHDCGNDVVDAWLQGFLPPILATPGYGAGTTAVLVIYDEDRPVPNLFIARSAKAGPIAGAASHALALHTIESMLNLPMLGDLRTSSGL